MYSNVVLDVDHHNFEDILELYKDRKGYSLDTDLTADDWTQVVDDYKKIVEARNRQGRSRRTRASNCGARSARCSRPG